MEMNNNFTTMKLRELEEFWYTVDHPRAALTEVKLPPNLYYAFLNELKSLACVDMGFGPIKYMGFTVDQNDILENRMIAKFSDGTMQCWKLDNGKMELAFIVPPPKNSNDFWLQDHLQKDRELLENFRSEQYNYKWISNRNHIN